MKRSDSNSGRTLLVADAYGHILERIGEAWRAHAQGGGFELILSERASVAACCERGAERAAIHWLDRHRAARASTCAPCPQILSIYHHLPGEEVRIRRVAKDCDVLAAGSRSWQERLQQLTGEAVFLTPQSIDTNWFRPPPDRLMRRREAGIPAETFLVGFAGKAAANVEDRKGLRVFCEVVRNLRLSRPLGVFFVGPGWEAAVAELGKTGLRVWHQSFAHCREVRAAYELLDALVVTATEEGGPATVMEAMSSHVPVVSSAVGHVPEMVWDGQTGFICKPDDPAGYIQRLELLAHSAEVRERIVNAARREMLIRWADEVVIPKIDFSAMQNMAKERFALRPAAEVRMRWQRMKWMQWRDVTVQLVRRRAN